jgi:hypothetical protein
MATLYVYIALQESARILLKALPSCESSVVAQYIAGLVRVIPSCCESHSFGGLSISDVRLFVLSGSISASDKSGPSTINMDEALEDTLGKCGWEKVQQLTPQEHWL